MITVWTYKEPNESLETVTHECNAQDYSRYFSRTRKEAMEDIESNLHPGRVLVEVTFKEMPCNPLSI